MTSLRAHRKRCAHLNITWKMSREEHCKTIRMLAGLAETASSVNIERVSVIIYSHLTEVEGWLKVYADYQRLLKAVEKVMKYHEPFRFDYDG